MKQSTKQSTNQRRCSLTDAITELQDALAGTIESAVTPNASSNVPSQAPYMVAGRYLTLAELCTWDLSLLRHLSPFTSNSSYNDALK